MFGKKIFSAVLIFALTIFSATASAEIKNFVGTGEYYMADAEESIEQAKNHAKLNAELNVMEQASVNVKSYSELKNFNLTKDEIITVTAGIMHILEVKYSIKSDFDDTLICTATVTADVDTDKIPELVERELKKRNLK